MSDNNVLLAVQNLSVNFSTEDGIAKAVQNVSFSLEKNTTFALVGESGCGKSVTALSIMRLIQKPQGKIVNGRIIFGKDDLMKLKDNQMRQIRGRKIAMIFQEPMTSLNPVQTIGQQIAEVIMLHQKKNLEQAWADVIDVLKKVGIPNAEQRADEYPHQMSGGMRQRIMIAMAISCEPVLLIADEPTTALDVTIQAQILDLLDELQQQNGMSILMITHDLAIVAERAKKVAVMYASKIAESADSRTLFNKPLHPYTQGLLKSLPQLGISTERLHTIPGTVPDPLYFPTGCKFHPRCPIGQDKQKCRENEPPLNEIQPGRCVACWYAEGYGES